MIIPASSGWTQPSTSRICQDSTRELVEIVKGLTHVSHVSIVKSGTFTQYSAPDISYPSCTRTVVLTVSSFNFTVASVVPTQDLSVLKAVLEGCLLEMKKQRAEAYSPRFKRCH